MPSGLGGILNLLPILVTLLGAFLAALWFSLVIWTYRDIQSRTHDTLVQILASLLVLVFNLPGLFLYLVLRPPETLAGAYARSLEEEALIADLQNQPTCPQCNSPVAADFLVCPRCRAQLRRLCAKCNRLLEPDWVVCPYCGAQ